MALWYTSSYTHRMWLILDMMGYSGMPKKSPHMHIGNIWKRSKPVQHDFLAIHQVWHPGLKTAKKCGICQKFIGEQEIYWYSIYKWLHEETSQNFLPYLTKSTVNLQFGSCVDHPQAPWLYSEAETLGLCDGHLTAMIGSYPLWTDMVHVSINLNKCYVLICIVMWYTWYTWTHHTCAQGYAVHKTYSDTWCKHKMHKVPAECLSNSFINTDSLLSQQRAMPAAGTGIRTHLAEESIPRQSLDPLPTCQNDSTTSVQDHRDPLGWSSHNQIDLPGSAMQN